MATKIEWADMSWNPTVGCTRVSRGCDLCYAFKLHDQRYAYNKRASEAEAAGQQPGFRFPKQYDLPFSQVQLLPERLDIPRRRLTPTRWFVDSMADLFHEEVPDGYLDQIFAEMFLSPQHEFLILTKRPERMVEYLDDLSVNRMAAVLNAAPERTVLANNGAVVSRVDRQMQDGLLDNVWLGTSVEDQRAAEERLPYLAEAPSRVRFVSAEPLLEPVDLSVEQHGINWVITGGETGPRSRPMSYQAAYGVYAQCRAADVPFFFKQWGDYDWRGVRVGRKAAGRKFAGREWNASPSPVHAAIGP